MSELPPTQDQINAATRENPNFAHEAAFIELSAQEAKARVMASRDPLVPGRHEHIAAQDTWGKYRRRENIPLSYNLNANSQEKTVNKTQPNVQDTAAPVATERAEQRIRTQAQDVGEHALNFIRKTEGSEQESISSERLREIAENSFFVIGTHFVDGERTFYHMPEQFFDTEKYGQYAGILDQQGYGNSSQGKALRGLAGTIGGRDSTSPENQALEELGVSERITLAPADEYLGPEFKGAGYSVLAYQTIGGDSKSKYQHSDSYGRPGDYVKYAMLVDNKTAVELGDAIRKQPKTARQILDQMMLGTRMSDPQQSPGQSYASDMRQAPYFSPQFKGMDEEWPAERPPYGDWDATNGGTRIALRTSIHQTPQNSEILESNARQR